MSTYEMVPRSLWRRVVGSPASALPEEVLPPVFGLLALGSSSAILAWGLELREDRTRFNKISLSRWRSQGTPHLSTQKGRKTESFRISPVVFFYNLLSPKIRNYSITSPGPYIPKEIFAISILSAPPFCSLLNVENCKGRDTGDWESTLERNFHFCLWPHTALLSLNHHHKIKLSNSLIYSHHWICLGGQKGYEQFLPFQAWKKLGPTSHYLISPRLPPQLPLPTSPAPTSSPSPPLPTRAPTPSLPPPFNPALLQSRGFRVAELLCWA